VRSNIAIETEVNVVSWPPLTVTLASIWINASSTCSNYDHQNGKLGRIGVFWSEMTWRSI
jgi:hypothetical protein